jgi:hypothetical protein
MEICAISNLKYNKKVGNMGYFQLEIE